MAENVLAEAFDTKQILGYDPTQYSNYTMAGVTVYCQENEFEEMQKMMESLQKIPTGQETLSLMALQGTPVIIEADMGASAGCFQPGKNIIRLNKSVGADKMCSCLVHEARHLWQHVQGRDRTESSNNLDYETTQMIYRATEADAQTQGYKACLEWAELGDRAPLERFNKDYPDIARGYEKGGLTGAFKGWYDDERITAAYENGYDVQRNLEDFLRPSRKMGKKKSMTATEIKSFCGGDRIEGFEEFVSSDYAKRIHLLTQAVLMMRNAKLTAHGFSNDESIAKMPVRDLKDNPDALMYSKKYVAEAEETLQSKKEDVRKNNPTSYPFMQSLERVFETVKKMNTDNEKGKPTEKLETVLSDEMSYVFLASKAKAGAEMKFFINDKTSKIALDRLEKDMPVLKGRKSPTNTVVQTAILARKTNSR